MSDIEKRARELLAAEYDKTDPKSADWIRTKAADGWPSLVAVIAALTPNWQAIEAAPRDGSPIIGFSPGVGCPILIRWVAPQDFMTTSECERYMDGYEAHEADEAEKWLETPEWWAADFNSGDMLSDDCQPTHWMPLPACPEVK